MLARRTAVDAELDNTLSRANAQHSMLNDYAKLMGAQGNEATSNLFSSLNAQDAASRFNAQAANTIAPIQSQMQFKSEMEQYQNKLRAAEEKARRRNYLLGQAVRVGLSSFI